MGDEAVQPDWVKHLISMEDGEGIELIQHTAWSVAEAAECVEMARRDISNEDSLPSEGNIRAFWKVYREMMSP